jgi:hypothetical protein
MITTIQIPQFDPDTELEDVFAAMLESGTSGVLEATEQGGRLLHFQALREAASRNVTRLRDVQASDRVSMNLTHGAERPPTGFEFGAFAMPGLPPQPQPAGGPDVPRLMLATLLAEQAVATTYTLAPAIRVCRGPGHHSHPPVTPNALGNCGICGQVLR